ncbi:MAG: CRISPR-associated RAMP protein Csx10 [Gemmatales bacterium]|nr:CRISPR-associated RAMP protein Csx10 [Gemmatales bacterium]MDW8174946.1 CRISPR-associated RAMP protein Csx10 [Gemmatales bacterium]
MMHSYLRLTLEQPIRSGGIKIGGGYLDTQDCLPGSVLRGAFAEWMKSHGRASEIRRAVAGLRIGSFFPTTDPQAYSLPLPATAVKCKLHPGFKGTDATLQSHGIRDSLLAAVAYSELVRLGGRFPVPFLLRCSEEKSPGEKCYQRMERAKGYYIRAGSAYREIKPGEILQTKVSLSRYRRAAQEAQLYRVVSIPPKIGDGQEQLYFVGRVWASDSQRVDDLCRALNEVGVGGLTTRGFGRVRCEPVQITLKPLAQRVLDFNSKLAQIWQELADLAQQCGSILPAQPPGTYFSLDLLSPAVLTDPEDIPTLVATLEYQGAPVQPIWWAVQGVFLGGFSTAWGLPKPTALAVAAASTYVFRMDLPATSIVPWLEELERRGIGRRTDEGLGEILICHPFHEEVKPV